MHQSRSVAQLKQQEHRNWQRDNRAFMHMCARYRHRSIVGTSSSIRGTGGGTCTPTNTPIHPQTQHFMLNIQNYLIKRKGILRMNICWRYLAVIIHKLNTINQFKFDKFSKKKTIRMLHGVIGMHVTSSMMRYCVMMLGSTQRPFRGFPTISLFHYNSELKPCSKWHHSTPLRLANQGPQANQATTTRTTFVPSTTITTATPRRITNTATPNKIILTIQEPRQPIQTQFYDARTNLSCADETEPETIAIQLKPSQRLLVITAAPSTGQPKIVQIRPQQQQQQQRRARLAANSSRIIRPGVSVIRVPFLPGSPLTPSAVKQSSLTRKNSNLVTLTHPQRVGGQPTNNPNTIIQLTSTPEVTNTVTDTVYYTIVPNSASQNSNQSLSQNSETILDSGVNTTSGNYTKLCAPQQQQSSQLSAQFSQTQTPRTLATMAGIRLTGADEHVTPSSMSGATPTATVEEINVPVFIDEYQQQPAPPTTAQTTNIKYSPISSNGSGIGSNANSNCDDNNNNSSSNIINGNEFEDFEFDMEMFEDISNVDMLISEDENKYNTNITTPSNMATNNNINDNGGINNNSMMDYNFESTKNEYAEDFDTYVPFNFSEWQLSPDFLPDLPDISENAVDFNNILLSSQNPMLPCASECSSNNASNCQQMQTHFLDNSEPFVPKIGDDDNFCVDDSMCAEAPTNSLPSISIVKNPTRMSTKRLKIHLPTTAPIDDQLSTPTVLGDIVDLQNEKMDIVTSICLGNSVSDIVESLKDKNSSPYTYTEEDSPSTPQSSYSVTTSTTPYSPAPSNISIHQPTSSSKRRRGRPAKAHSDQPDPMHLERIPDVERKKLLDRAKNNEASRVSRRKNKEREEQEKETERKMLERNLELKAELQEWERRQKKLERVLMRSTTFLQKMACKDP